MKSIEQQGETQPKKFRVQCHKCKCVFTYDQIDVESDGREGDYVTCANEECKSFIAHSLSTEVE
jgi:hypothetical protein